MKYSSLQKEFYTSAMRNNGLLPKEIDTADLPIEMLNEWRNEAILDMYQNTDAKIDAILKTFRASSATLTKLLKSPGVGRRPNPRTTQLSPVDEQQVVEDYESGVITTEILTKHKLSSSRLYKIIDSAGVPKRYSNDTSHDARLKRLFTDFAKFESVNLRLSKAEKNSPEYYSLFTLRNKYARFILDILNKFDNTTLLTAIDKLIETKSLNHQVTLTAKNLRAAIMRNIEKNSDSTNQVAG